MELTVFLEQGPEFENGHRFPMVYTLPEQCYVLAETSTSDITGIAGEICLAPYGNSGTRAGYTCGKDGK
jgi:hypothetical protein